ncbi:KRAB-A domain-containing protein 2 [Trichonephila clavipes]|uniref:KRAB-A domain-containing protein 2 n=1 Tax=Trichonephila clavipes TaxID=2585209 RepID=A0A8X6S815_TRICX|nr:KRAB-A domain-containing protein 2 [Trichonephila clavipes]
MGGSFPIMWWPALKIVHGKPRHSQSHGSVERTNQDSENMLCTWIQDNKSDHWSEGLHFVQFMKNRAHHSGIRRTPN